MDLEKTLNKLKNVEEKTRATIIKVIEGIPVNDDVTKLSKNCFTVQSSLVFKEKILSTEYFNFQNTAGHMCKYIQSCRIESIMPFLKDVVMVGAIRYPYRCYIAMPVRQYINEQPFDGKLGIKETRGSKINKQRAGV